jgi:4-aminobutyrate aminotransferase-like enzyme
MSVAGSMGPKKGFGPLLSSVIHAPFCYCYRCPFDKCVETCNLHCLDYLDYAVSRESAGELCVLITEPYQGGAGSIVPPPGYMERLFGWVRAKGMYFILDEVQSSFGRTGKMFAFEHWGIEPDLVCLGKGLGSGIPCSAVMGCSAIMDVLQPGELGSTNGGNPVSARAGLAAIEIIEREGLVDNAARLGEMMMAEFRRMATQIEPLGDVRGMGLAIGLELVADKASKKPAPELTKRIVQEAYRRGLCLIAPIGMYGNVIRVAPPLVITEDQARLGLQLLAEAVRAAMK